MFHLLKLRKKENFIIFIPETYLNFSDLDECETGSHTCHAQATCCNTLGSFNCYCNAGYSGDGKDCTGKFSLTISHIKFTKGRIS